MGGGTDSTPDTIAPRNAFRRAPGVSQGSSNDGDLAILVATVGAADLFRIFLRRARFPSIVREPPPPMAIFLGVFVLDLVLSIMLRRVNIPFFVCRRLVCRRRSRNLIWASYLAFSFDLGAVSRSN